MGFRRSGQRRFHAHRIDADGPVRSFGVAYRPFDASPSSRLAIPGLRLPRFGGLGLPARRVRGASVGPGRLGRRARLGLPAGFLVAVAGVVMISGQLRPITGSSGGVSASGTGDSGVLAGSAAVPESRRFPARSPDPLGARSALDVRLPAAPSTLTGYRWPLEGSRVTQAFGPSSGGSFIVDGHGFHDGIDVASFCGDHVVAAHDGTVIAAGRHWVDAIGWVGDLAGYKARLDAKQAWGGLAVVVVIDDGNGYRSIYVHFRRAVVKVGQHVKAGDFIGTEGATGYARGCHLHYGLFSPLALGRFQTDPEIVRRTLAPVAVVARIDPLLVLPSLESARNTWGWGARESD